ncbi:MAG: adenylate/guanylate cyclase domain-containing protein [Maribacter sp.]|nr:adenylate/guanylate cyclase domain-containing protein [Maribacter sp.]
MFSPKTKRNIIRIIPFGVIWFIFGITYLLLERGLLGQLDYYPATGNPYEFGGVTIIFIISVVITGLLVGTFEILFLGTLFKSLSFGKKILFKSIIYVALILTFLVVSTVINNAYILNSGFWDSDVWSNVWAFVFSFAFLSVVVFITVIIGISIFFSEVSANLGISVLHNFFVGKYHKPKVEERIFMFLDMKSSTTIAEKLGHEKYFQMLNAYYSDFTDSIINHNGEIYQYVGDEIVISWSLKNGLGDNNFLKCFFSLKAALFNQSKRYLSKYGVIPTFKAGFHFGKVTIGEIGELKKDIIFTGDVLNTTARIQGLCNTFNVDLLISGQLRNKMMPAPNFQIKSLGKKELRGKKELIELFTVHST